MVNGILQMLLVSVTRASAPRAPLIRKNYFKYNKYNKYVKYVKYVKLEALASLASLEF